MIMIINYQIVFSMSRFNDSENLRKFLEGIQTSYYIHSVDSFDKPVSKGVHFQCMPVSAGLVHD